MTLAEDNRITGLSEIYDLGGEIEGMADQFYVYVYDEITAKYLRNGIFTQGDWLYEDSIQDDYCPIVIKNSIHSNYKIGDIIEVGVILHHSYPPLDTPYETQRIKVDCRVSGILSSLKPFHLAMNIKTSTADSIEVMFRSNPPSDSLTIYMPYLSAFDEHRNQSDSFFIYFESETTEQEMKEFQRSIVKYGRSMMGKDIIGETKELADFTLGSNFFIFYTFLGLALMGAFCTSFLNIRKTMKSISLYYLNGCSKVKAKWIYFTYYFLLFLLSFGVYMIFIYEWWRKAHFSGIGPEHVFAKNLETHPFMLFVLGIITFAIFAIASIVPFAIYNRKSKIQLVKEK